MKNILLIHSMYQIYGGEDSNLEDEVSLLEKEFNVEKIIFKNSDSLNLIDILSFFFNSNYFSNKILKNKLDNWNVDSAYIHNSWFKSNLGIFKILKKRKIDTIVKIHNFRYFCTLSYFSNKHALKNKTCNACGFVGKGSFRFNKYYSDSFIKSFFVIWHNKKYLKILKSNEIKVLAISNFHREQLLRAGIDSKRIHIYLNPIKKFKVIEKSYNPNSDYIVYVGRLTESKGINELISVWTNFENKNLKLYIVGKPDSKLLNTENMKNHNILFLGEKSHEEALSVIKNARALITLTKMYEGQPRVLCEASTMGVPSIFPDFGSMGDFFPKDYILKFQQFDYEDLNLKLNSIFEIDSLNSLSKEVFENINNLLDDKKLIFKFKQIMDKKNE